MFFWGGSLEQCMLPGTMRPSRVGLDPWAPLRLNRGVCMCICVCGSHTVWACLFIFLRSVCPQCACRPQGRRCRRRCLAVCSPCNACLCLLECVRACVCLSRELWCEAPAPAPALHGMPAAWRLLSWNLPGDIIKRWQGRQVRAPAAVCRKRRLPEKRVSL